MPRQSRLVIAGLPLHVIHRGNNRTPCFYVDEDRLVYLDILKTCAAEFALEIHAYVLMTNHVHLLATPPGVLTAAATMKLVAQRYSQYINRRYKRTGSLWEGRYRSSIIGDDHYFLTCQKYIELNPVRAQMVSHPGDYAWSSYLANAQGKPNELITQHAVVRKLADDLTLRQMRYRELFLQALDVELVDQVRQAAKGGHVFGNEAFAETVAALLNRKRAKRNGRPRKTASTNKA